MQQFVKLRSLRKYKYVCQDFQKNFYSKRHQQMNEPLLNHCFAHLFNYAWVFLLETGTHLFLLSPEIIISSTLENSAHVIVFSIGRVRPDCLLCVFQERWMGRRKSAKTKTSSRVNKENRKPGPTVIFLAIRAIHLLLNANGFGNGPMLDLMNISSHWRWRVIFRRGYWKLPFKLPHYADRSIFELKQEVRAQNRSRLCHEDAKNEHLGYLPSGSWLCQQRSNTAHG